MRVAIIDFETTGLLDEKRKFDYMAQPGIVQIGGFVLELPAPEGAVGIATFEMLVDPEMPIPEVVTKIHGKTNEMVKGCPTAYAAIPALAQFVKGADYWAGYNIKFDKGVLWSQLERYGYQTSFPWPPLELEVMTLVARHLGNVPGKNHDKWKLTAAYEKIIGKSLVGAHDALADVKACAELIVKLWSPV